MILNVVNCIERRPHVLDKKEKVKGGGGGRGGQNSACKQWKQQETRSKNQNPIPLKKVFVCQNKSNQIKQDFLLLNFYSDRRITKEKRKRQQL